MHVGNHDIFQILRFLTTLEDSVASKRRALLSLRVILCYAYGLYVMILPKQLLTK